MIEKILLDIRDGSDVGPNLVEVMKKLNELIDVVNELGRHVERLPECQNRDCVGRGPHVHEWPEPKVYIGQRGISHG